MDAETMVREEILQKTPTRSRHSVSESMSSVGHKKSNDKCLPNTHPKIKRVHEWLQYQSSNLNSTVPPPPLPTVITDCEASGEYTTGKS